MCMQWLDRRPLPILDSNISCTYAYVDTVPCGQVDGQKSPNNYSNPPPTLRFAARVKYINMTWLNDNRRTPILYRACSHKEASSLQPILYRVCSHKAASRVQHNYGDQHL